jgi:glycosyltransferase involved in cell wall biosynthesis
MRILLVNYEYPPVGAGAATATQAIGQAFVKAGHDVVVITGRYKDLPAHATENGITVHRIPSLRKAIDRSGVVEMASFLAAGLIVAPGIIQRHQIEAAIVFFSMPCGPIGLLGRWMRGVPYIVSLRGGDVPGAEPSLDSIHRILAPLRRAVLKNSAGIVANSEGLKKMAEAADPFAVRVIPNGVDADFFVPPRATATRNNAALRVLFAGRFRAQKNLSLLLRQVSQLPRGAVELHLVGDGPERDELGRLAAGLGLAAIIWHGWLPRGALRDVYQSCDCFVNPSLYEGMPNTVLEAMACGLPVIASNVPGNNSVVEDEQTGYLFGLTEPDGLSRALERLIHDPRLAARLGASGRTRAVDNFTWSETAKDYLALLSENR